MADDGGAARRGARPGPRGGVTCPTGPLGLDPLLLEILACPCDRHAPVEPDEAASALVCTVCGTAVPGPRRHPGDAAGRRDARAARHRRAPPARRGRPRVLVVRGALKDYDWGRVDGLASWAGAATGGPQAELWFGAHPSGPSPVLDAAGRRLRRPARRPDGRVGRPLLVKLLAAGGTRCRSRSTRTPRTRRAGLGRASTGSRPASGSTPTVAEKTELLVALQPFHAHAGWRDAQRGRCGAGRRRGSAEPMRRPGPCRPSQRRGGRLLGMARRALPGDGPAAPGVPAVAVGADPTPRSTPLARVAATHPRDPGAGCGGPARARGAGPRRRRLRPRRRARTPTWRPAAWRS